MSGSEYAGSGAFVVEPSECVVPAGQQQKFTVRFSSWQVGTHSVNLVGRQYFVQQHDDASNSSSGSGGLTVTLWPRQQEQQQQQQGAAGAGGPLELIVSGGLAVPRACRCQLIVSTGCNICARITSSAYAFAYICCCCCLCVCCCRWLPRCCSTPACPHATAAAVPVSLHSASTAHPRGPQLPAMDLLQHTCTWQPCQLQALHPTGQYSWLPAGIPAGSGGAVCAGGCSAVCGAGPGGFQVRCASVLRTHTYSRVNLHKN